MPFDEHRLLSIRAWLALPVLFAAAVLGLTGFGGVLLDADWEVALSSWVFGPAAGVTALLAGGVDWTHPRQRWPVGIGYPLLVFAVGLLLAPFSLPAPIAMAVGTPALVTLGVLIARERDKVIPIA
ncbi:hypothetical protein [Actinophytocola sp.]|uniref:hypothetical protein n=1 Tax=Actinophytocola sp. TaxID=1872138 RepID=UPI002D806B5C|nr:hypothetical protein [Actinophytocola sp.]HET9141183.1 hypothetical protein [Actinophytocola sp.]HEU5106988.1 hypothetical protein [Micromonosporaceae bacterium]